MGKIAMSKSDQTPVALGSGLVALDIVLSVDATAPIRNYAGGTCGNVLTILQYLGWHSFPIARLGRDAAAAHLLSDLERWGVRADFLPQEEGILTPVIVQQNRRGRSGEMSHRFSWQCPSCGSYWPSFRPPTRKYVESLSEQIKKVNVCFIDRVSAGTIRLAELSAELGAVVHFEPQSIGDERLFNRAVQLATVVKYSTDRLAKLPGRHKPPLEIRTLGKEGLEFRSDSTRQWKRLAALPVDGIVDTSGAGDWLAAGFLNRAGLAGRKTFDSLSQRKIIEGLKIGQALAAWNCRFEGARGAMYMSRGAATLQKRALALLEGRAQARDPDRAMTALALARVGDLCRSCSTVAGAMMPKGHHSAT